MKIDDCSDASNVRIQSNCGDELCLRARDFSQEFSYQFLTSMWQEIG